MSKRRHDDSRAGGAKPREVQLSSAQVASVIDNIGASMVLVDREFRVLWCNMMAAEYARSVRPGEARCYEQFFQRDSPCEFCLVNATFETGQPQTDSCSRELPGHGFRHYRIATAPVFDESGQVVQVLELIHNVTAQRMAESALARYKCLIDSSNDFMIVADDEGIVLLANRKLLDEFGYAEEELVGHHVTLVIPEVDRQMADDVATRARSAGIDMATLRLVRKNGTQLPVQISVSYDADNAVLHAVARDITEQLRVEAELRQRSEELEEQNRKVLEASEEKTRFFRSVSHDLRAPLTSIIGFAEILLEDADEPLTKSQSVKVNRIAGNAHRLLRLVNDLLDLSKLDAGRMRLELAQVKLGELLAQVVNNMQPLADEKGLRLSLEIPRALPRITTDEQKVGQILVNLISNAINFTREGGVTVTAYRNGISARIEVRDTGIGIADKDIPEVFKEFHQVARQGPGQRGTGLGLAIARKLAALLGGEITVTSRLGVGSTFTLSLPVNAKCSVLNAQ